MISRKSSAYSSMIRRAAFKREGSGFDASICPEGSSDGFIRQCFDSARADY